MDKIKSNQKKNSITSYIYAAIVALLVIACAITIAFVNAKNTTSTTSENLSVGNESVQVATNVFVVPMKNATIAKDYSASELQFNDTLKQWEIHKAIDFLPSEDLNVYSISDGTVSNVYTNYLEGTVVEISHKDGLVSIYKSLNDNLQVAVGDRVSAGQVVGSIENSMAQELNTGAHLHLEITKNGAKVNPNDYLDLGIK